MMIKTISIIISREEAIGYPILKVGEQPFLVGENVSFNFTDSALKQGIRHIPYPQER